MKVIKIFLASSIDELKSERNELGRFILGINNLNLERGIYCHLELCENYDSSISVRKRKQDDYNEFIKGSDAVFVLFCEKAGNYTVEELKLAKNCFRESGKPKVYTYFKNFDENNLTDEVRKVYELIKDEYQHFFGTFESIAAVEVDILRAMFEICPNDALSISEKNGIVYFGDEKIMKVDELDYIKNNKAIDNLKKKIAGLKSGDEKYTEGYYGDEIDNEIENCEQQLKDRYAKCFKALEDRYKNISSATKTDYELQLSYNASAKGDYKKVIEILDRNNLKNDTEKFIKESEIQVKRYLETTFEKYRQRINALSQTVDYDELERTYEDAVNAIRKLHLYDIDVSCLNVWCDFVHFLYYTNKGEKALTLGKKLNETYDLKYDACGEWDRAILYNVLAMLSNMQNKSKKAEEFFIKAVESCSKVAEKDCKQSNEVRAMIYSNVGTYYSSTQNMFMSEKYFNLAIKELEILLEEDLEIAKNLATVYGNLGIHFAEQRNNEKAEEYLNKAVDICENASFDISPKLAIAYSNLGYFYNEQRNYDKAKKYLELSTEMLEILAKSTPKQFSGKLATNYNNIGYFYLHQGDFLQAEKYYIKSEEVYKWLAYEWPERYNFDLALCYDALGTLHYEKSSDELSEKYFILSKNMLEELVGKSFEIYASDLARVYGALFALLFRNKKTKQAKEYILNSIQLYKKLSRLNCIRYNPNLAVNYYIYASMIDSDNYFKMAYDIAMKCPYDTECCGIIERLKGKF